MKREAYVLSVPYERERLDFAAALADLAGASISRAGRQRRVQVEIDPAQRGALRARLPAYVIVEPLIEHDFDGSDRVASAR